MNKKQTTAIVVGIVGAVAAVLATGLRAPSVVVPGPRVPGGQIIIVRQPYPVASHAAVLGIAALTVGAVYVLRSRPAA